MPRHNARWFALLLAGSTLIFVNTVAVAEVKRFVRFQVGDKELTGILDDRGSIHAIVGEPWGEYTEGAAIYPLDSVKLLAPVARPSQVLALAGSYKSHLGGANHVTTVVTTTKVTTDVSTGQTTSTSNTTVETTKPGEVPEKFQIPQVFFKSPSCLVPDGAEIVIPPGTKQVDYEAELVVVMGRKASRVDEQEARQCIFGVTCGNDVSARDWQKSDVQWWRAKGSDTFGPLGPCIVTGLNYDDLLVTLRLNGKVMQQERTSQLIHNVPKMVSTVSQYVTLHPGDLIYTGTSGTTSPIKPGDTVEVEIEGIGKLTNKVVASPAR